MNGLRSYIAKRPSLKGGLFCFTGPTERGNALLYVFLAVGLMAALTYSYVQDSRENYASQSAVSIAEELYSQINMIKAAVVQCTLEYPNGMDPTVCSCTPLNPPYPLSPSDPLNPNSPAGTAAAGDDYVRHLTCVGAPTGLAAMFSGTSNQGRFLPPPPAGFNEWVYKNDGGGVYIQITSTGDAASVNALSRVLNKFVAGTSQASVTGLTLKVWIQQD